jgi:glycosyltransferase involved in cell wall biosynthesis
MASLTAVVFSKDRPLQVEATVRSLLATCEDAHDLTVAVLYLASSAAMGERYRRAAAELPQARFVAEDGFQPTLRGLLDAPAPLWLFAVDDAIFVRPWRIEAIAAVLADPLALGYSLRLGRNTVHCYPFNRAQRLPIFAQAPGGALSFDWTLSELDFGYPLELSSSIYRAADLSPLLERLTYRNPNELESRLHEARAAMSERRPRLFCSPLSVAFSTPLNAVQTDFPNRRGARAAYTPDRLAALFDAGVRVDVAALRGYTPRGCHEEIDLPLGRGAPPPRVSVIVPCHGQAALLPHAVASVVAQTFEDWELVVVDDGSPDDTAAVARALAARWPARRIRLVEQPNGGLAAARNAGVAAARGELILPLDADDEIEATFLARTVAALDADPAASIAFTDVRRFGNDDGVWRMGPFDLAQLRSANRATCTSLYRRSVWEQAGGYNPNMTVGYEDWDFWVGAAARGFRAVHVAEPLFRYRIRSGSMVTRAHAHHHQLRARIVLNHPAAFSQPERAHAAALLARDPLPARPAPAPSSLPVPVPASASASPLVSVVVPCFRKAAYLEEAVASVIGQSFTDWEMIIIDDGSPDDSAAVAERLIAAHPGQRVRLLRQENGGPAAARNAGVAAAAGRYILPLDADDTIDPQFLAKSVAALHADARVAVVATDGVTFGAYAAPLDARPLVGVDAIKRDNSISYCCLYRREVWEAVGGYNTNLFAYEDWDFWVGAKERGFGFAHLTEPLFRYRVKADGLMSAARAFDRQLRCRLLLNHPALFSDRERAEAEAFLRANPLPAPGAPAAHRAAG